MMCFVSLGHRCYGQWPLNADKLIIIFYAAFRTRVYTLQCDDR